MIRWLLATGLRMLADALEPEEPLDLRLEDVERLNANLRAYQQARLDLQRRMVDPSAWPPLRVVTDPRASVTFGVAGAVPVPPGGACTCQLRVGSDGLTGPGRLYFDLDAPCSHGKTPTPAAPTPTTKETDPR